MVAKGGFMEVNMKRVLLYEETFDYAARLSEKENAELFKAQIKKDINNLKLLLKTDFDQLNDSELYYLLSNLYSIVLTEEDILEVLSKKNNRNYTKTWHMHTNMKYDGIVKENNGKTVDWWKQPYRVYYCVASDENTYSLLNVNKDYSKDEIKSLLENGDIIILKEEKQKIYSYKDDKKYEDYEKISNLDVSINNWMNLQKMLDNDDIKEFGKILRRTFTKKKIMQDALEYIKDMDYDLDLIFKSINLHYGCEEVIAKLCYDWFNSSTEKMAYTDMKEGLKIHHH